VKHRHDLRKLARGQPCLIRVPGVCNGRTDTTVLCHIRMTGISGMGYKAPDALGAHGCSHCHAYCDGQTYGPHSAQDRRLFLLEGMARTQAWLIERGVLRW
jgi:hypothetical protein